MSINILVADYPPSCSCPWLMRIPIVRNQNYKKQWIELTDVVLYSFAEYLDGTYGFWAAGKSGWFEFDLVAPSYRQIHNQMSEATSWIYILADKINNQKSKPPANFDGSKLEKYMQSVFSDVSTSQLMDPTARLCG